MTAADRPCLGWQVAVEEWDEFEGMVAEKHGTATLYAGIELERAWHEWRDVHPLEEHANRLLEAAGLPRDAGRKKNPDGLPTLDAVETERTFVRVHADVKTEMKQYAKAEGKAPHEILRAVVNWYRGGGRDARLVEKFNRVVPVAEAALRSVEGDTGGLTKSDRVEIAIARHLSDDKQFTRTDLADAIDAETSGTDYYHDEYAPRVIERLNVVEHPNNSELLVQPEDAAEYARAEADAEAADLSAATRRAATDGGHPEGGDDG